MLIAVLALLGVDLIVIVAFVAFLVSRKRWVRRQPGAFRGAIRVDGQHPAHPGEVKRLGEAPVVVRLRAGTAAAEVAAGADDSSRLLGPHRKAPAATVAPGSNQASAPLRLDDGESRLVRRTTTTRAIRNIKANRPWTVPSVS